MVRRSPLALWPDRLDSRVFARSGRRFAVSSTQRHSHGLVRSFRVLRAPSRRLASAPSRVWMGCTSSSHEVLRPFSVSPHRAAADLAGLASPGRLRPQVFSTSRRFRPPRAWRPCFMPHPLMGFHPPELCSSRAAVRRFQRRCPLGVERVLGTPRRRENRVPPAGNANHRTGAGTAPKRSTHRPRAGGSPHRRNNGASRCCEPTLTAGAAHGPARDPRPRPVENRSSPPITGSVRWPWERSRLQGFAPRESPPLRRRWFRPTRGA